MEQRPGLTWCYGTAPVAGDTAVFETFIKTTPERLWQAIVDPEQRRIYSFGVGTTSSWEVGSSYEAGVPGVVEIARGENLVLEPGRLLVQTYTALWSEAVRSQGVTRVSWEIEPIGTSCRLTIVHDRLPVPANSELYGGWAMILAGLKTWLESGERLDTPGSLMHGAG